ncbi:DNA adenine methylase [Nitrosospira sp. Nsp1]|uniref:DNA adenine methylase n=1 Tax=Nitrosospira sp. Nsp1 TaxID=136547 RepID=UPI001C40AFD0|nr:DNA adenine methylase [Nitrosospira sp. Nsp1]
MMLEQVTRPALRYHGGKFRLAAWIIKFFPPHRVYVEPFGGGASLLLRKSRVYAEIYNDLDDELVNVFSVLRNRGDELLEALKLTPFARAEFDLSYEISTCPVEQARRTIVRSFMGFGSAAASGKRTGFRANSNRSHTTPAYDWKNYPDALPVIIERLRGVIVENRDAAEVIQQHDSEETLIYADPPYVLSTRSLRGGIKSYTAHTGYKYEMSDDEHRALAKLLHSVSGMVVLSGYSSKLYEHELYAKWERFEKQSMADGAKPRTEIVWINPACSEALHAASGLFGAYRG